jgi:peptidoglycan-N-acetylmuramic acid deacetylase
MLLAFVTVLASLGLSDGVAIAADPTVIARGPSTHRTVALTIDDGWDPEQCEAIYDTLVEFGIPATWFPNAIRVRASPSLWRRIGQRFELANHTTHHPSLPRLSRREIREEIASDERIVESITGRQMSKILRPPYGAYDRKVVREAGRLGYSVIALWDVSAADTASRTPDRRIAENLLGGRPGSVILMHCGPPVTARVLPIVIAHYACRGFRFASLGNLLAGSPGVAAKVMCPAPHLPPHENASTPRPLDKALRALDWRLAAAAADGILTAVDPEDVVTLDFTRHAASGRAGCQTFAARVWMKEDALRFRKPAHDLAACEAPVSRTASDNLAALLATVGFRIDGDALFFVDAEGRDRLRFDSVDPASVVRAWRVVMIADEAGARMPLAPGAVTATFAADGRIQGATGCGPYAAPYALDGDALTVGEVRLGAIVCDEASALSQARLASALASVATWRTAGPELELQDRSGSVLIELAPMTPVARTSERHE